MHFLWCQACEVEFLPRRGHHLTACPQCGTSIPTELAQRTPHREPLRLAVKNRAPWVPPWLATLSGIGTSFVWFSNVWHGWLTYLTLGLGLIGLWATAVWRWAKRTVVLEIGLGRIAAPSRLKPWPGRWLPSGSVARVAVVPAPKEPKLRTVVAELHGGEKVPLLDDVLAEDAQAVAAALEAALRAPASGGIPEVHLAASEREARVEWNCGRAVSVSIRPDSLRVKCSGVPDVELDTDFVDTILVLPSAEQGFNLVAVPRKGSPRELLAGEPAREPLELVAREIRRVLHLELPPAKASG